MDKELQDTIQRIIAFPQHIRAYLVEILLESLDFEEDFAIQQEWIDEVTRRCREIDEGRVELIPGKDALAQLRQEAIPV